MSAMHLELLLVRHGATEWNAAGRYQGHTDVPLSREGRAQAAMLAPVLAPLEDRAPLVFSSDLGRARETAALACPWALSHQDARLRELAFGALEGLTYEESAARFGDRFIAWLEDPAAMAPPGGETLTQLHDRLDDWLSTLPDAGCVIAFTHGGVVRALLSRLRGAPFDAGIRVEPASVVQLMTKPGAGAWSVAGSGPARTQERTPVPGFVMRIIEGEAQ